MIVCMYHERESRKSYILWKICLNIVHLERLLNFKITMFNDAMFRSSIWSTKTIMRPSNRILETVLQSLNYHDMYVINDKVSSIKIWNTTR